MTNRSFRFFYIIILSTFLSCQNEIQLDFPKRQIEISSALSQSLSKQIKKDVSVTLADDLELTLWAADTLVQDPIAISIDDQGAIYYTKANRLTNSEFDIRSHRNWMTASISFQSVEDRRAFLRETFSETNEEGKKFLKDLNEDGILDWKDLTVEKEQIWVVEDKDEDGYAEHAHLYIEDFHEEITDLANGIEYHDGEVFLPVGPDLWRIKDTNQDGIADQKESISHGFAVHIGFGAHGMSGAKIGPDGRIWWGIGDIGMNLVDKEGKEWKYPNRGVVVRSELDGSNFEVYCYGVRNTHEFDFDKYGNLISVDNDGDHQGERERLVYLINGSDTGWRINWQFGKYTDPDNNKYKVWMDEKLGVPHWEGQSAYILPCIQNYVNGPTGFAYNPGTALGPQYDEHFFVAEFRGTPSSSPIHAFKLKPTGASFELESTKEVVKGLLPSGLDFGPDGALYFADWINGWGTKDQGRIWKLDMPSESNNELRENTRELLKDDISKFDEEVISNLLFSKDMRLRSKAQFELAKRGKAGFNIFVETFENSEHQLARIHSLWGIAQMARQHNSDPDILVSALQDKDEEIVTQAIKMIGDIYLPKGDLLVPFLNHKSLRVRLHAAEALGRIKHTAAVTGLINMLRENNDRDKWLRQAGIIALGRIGDNNAMTALESDPSIAVRTAAVNALRRMAHPDIGQFLDDKNEFIATEAARGINDDFSIPEALPKLAQALLDLRFTEEAFIRRAINANLRVGELENLKYLLSYAKETSAPAAMRAEALDALSTWANPSPLDRVDGRYRGKIVRDITPVTEAVEPELQILLNDKNIAVKIASLNVVKRLGLKDKSDSVFDLFRSSNDAAVRSACIEVLHSINADKLSTALDLALEDKSPIVRSFVLAILPESNLSAENATRLYIDVLKTGSIKEKQIAYRGLGKLDDPMARNLLRNAMMAIPQNKVEKELHLDIIEGVRDFEDSMLWDELDEMKRIQKESDPLADYRETIYGGDRQKGQTIFYENEKAECVRCHTIFEYGGDAGPPLTGLADRLTPEKMLESLIHPSAAFADGYGLVVLVLNNEERITGIVQSESNKEITIQVSKGLDKTIAKSQIAERHNMPSSMVPVGNVLDPLDIRDLMAFLQDLKLED